MNRCYLVGNIKYVNLGLYNTLTIPHDTLYHLLYRSIISCGMLNGSLRFSGYIYMLPQSINLDM
jgi:hypothetical protein